MSSAADGWWCVDGDEAWNGWSWQRAVARGHEVHVQARGDSIAFVVQHLEGEGSSTSHAGASQA